MTSIALLGAGGKMGYRLSRNLKATRFDVRHVEVSPAGRDRLKTGIGLDCVDLDTALDGAQLVVLAVPDTAIGKVAGGIESNLKAGTIVVVLDAAAPFAGHLPHARPDDPISSPTPAIRRSSTTKARRLPGTTISAACTRSSTS